MYWANETLLVRMAEVVNIHNRTEIFVGPECHECKHFSRGKNKNFLTIKLILNYEILKSNTSSLVVKLPFLIGKISISLNSLNDIPNILNFVFFVPAWVLLIFLCYPEFPDNRKDKNCFKTKLKVWKQMSRRGVEEFTKNYQTQLEV